jgi:hypothetical protein
MRIFERIDVFLWKKGFIYTPIRAVARNLFLFSSFIFLVGICLFSWSEQVFWAGSFCMLFSWNFYTIALAVIHLMPIAIPSSDRNAVVTAHVVKKGLLIRSQIRLFITGIFVYSALVTFQASRVALVAGLSSAVIIIPISLIFRR